MKTRLLLALAALAVAGSALAQDIQFRGASGGGGGAATSITPGSTTVTGVTNCFGFVDASNLFQCNNTLAAYDSVNQTATLAQGTAAVYGSDLVTNGTFTGNATGWTLGGGGGAPDWAYATNNVTHGNSGGTTALQPSTPLTVSAGAVYAITFTISGLSAGTVTPSIGATAGNAYDANGTYTVILGATDTTNLKFTPTTTLVATLDTISCKLVTPGQPTLVLSNGSFPLEVRANTAGASYFFGTLAGRNATGSNNLGMGLWTLRFMAAGNQNTILGSQSGQAIGSFSDNTCVGYSCLNSTGSNNTCVGSGCLANIQTGSNNAALGHAAGVAVGPTGQSWMILLGEQVKGTASNQAVLGSDAAGGGVTDFYTGHGVTKASPGTFTLHGTGGSGSNNTASDYEVAAGLSTGTGAVGRVILSTAVPAASGSSAQTKIQREFVGTSVSVTNNSATTMATFTCASDTVCGTIVHYGVEVNDGASHHQQTEIGMVTCNVTNANGTFVQGGTGGCTKFGNVQTISASGGTLTVTWTLTGANPALLQVNSNTGTITPASGFPRVTYTVENLTNQAVTVP